MKMYIHQNHRHLFRAEILSWSLVWIKYAPPSLSSLSQILLPQNIIRWSCRKYLSKESSPSLYPAFSHPQSIPHPKYNRWFRQKPSVGIETLQLGPSSPQSSNFQPITLTHCPLHVKCGLLVSIIWIRDNNSKEWGRKQHENQFIWEEAFGSGKKCTVWATLTKNWWTMGCIASLLSPKTSLFSGHHSSFSGLWGAENIQGAKEGSLPEQWNSKGNSKSGKGVCLNGAIPRVGS